MLKKTQKHTNIIRVSLKTVLFFLSLTLSLELLLHMIRVAVVQLPFVIEPELLLFNILGVKENQSQRRCGALKLNITFKINYILYVSCANITSPVLFFFLSIYFLNRLDHHRFH